MKRLVDMSKRLACEEKDRLGMELRLRTTGEEVADLGKSI